MKSSDDTPPRLSPSEAAALLRRPKRTKYRAVRTVVDGVTFASKREATVYAELRIRERAGEIQRLELQPRYEFWVNGVQLRGDGGKPLYYAADFRYVDLSRVGPQGQIGCTVVVDVKGVRTPLYRLKKALVEALYPGTVIEERR